MLALQRARTTDTSIYEEAFPPTGERPYLDREDSHYHNYEKYEGSYNDDAKSKRSSYSSSDEDPIEYPEGGLKAWLVVAGSFLGLLCTFGLSIALGTIQSYLLNNQLKGYTESQVSWIFSLWLFGMYTGSIQVGPLFDQYGIRALVIPGAVLHVLAIMVLSVCTEFWQFVLGFSVLGGISSAMIFNPSVAVVGHYFYRRRALATGIALTGAAFGGIIFPQILTKLFDTVGYGWAIRILGFIMLVMLVLCSILADARQLRDADYKKGSSIDLRSLCDFQFLAVAIGVFMLEWAYFSPISYLNLYSEHQGYSAEFSSQLTAIIGAFSVVGRILPGYLGDNYGCFNMVILMHFMTGLVCLIVWLPFGHSQAGLRAFAALFGFFSGSCSGLVPACIGRISDTRQYGTRYGTCYAVASLGILTGLPICGALKGSDYTGTIVFTGVIFIVAAISFAIARVLKGNQKILLF